jgi:hypothetical protein
MSDLLLNPANDEEEIDEPILVPATEDAEEYDEPLNASAMNTSGILLGAVEDEQDEVDEQLPMDLADSGAQDMIKGHISSAECVDALSAITTDCWDISSWIIYLEEVQQGRGGDTTIEEAYGKILAQFPRSAKFWLNLAQHYLSVGDVRHAEETFSKSVIVCRSIELWRAYLNHLTAIFQETLKYTVQTEQYVTTRAKCETAFEQACDNVGLWLGAYPIWRGYIDFVKCLPETGMIEAGKKLHMLRGVYQRAVSVALDQSDELWAEYESFEKSCGEQSAEIILPDFNRKYLHSKSIMRERKKLVMNIVFDRLATPPMHAASELQQLELWNNWIK